MQSASRLLLEIRSARSLGDKPLVMGSQIVSSMLCYEHDSVISDVNCSVGARGQDQTTIAAHMVASRSIYQGATPLMAMIATENDNKCNIYLKSSTNGDYHLLCWDNSSLTTGCDDDDSHAQFTLMYNSVSKTSNEEYFEMFLSNKQVVVSPDNQSLILVSELEKDNILCDKFYPANDSGDTRIYINPERSAFLGRKIGENRVQVAMTRDMERYDNLFKIQKI